MNRILKIIPALIILIQMCTWAQQKRVFQPEDLYQIHRVYDPQISPDGKWIAYTISRPCLQENGFDRDIWLISMKGGTPRQLTNSPASDRLPRWSPDGKKLAFVSDRNGTDNVWIIDPIGGEAVQLTDSPTALHSPIWSRNGKWILCTSRVVVADDPDPENPA